MDLRHGRWMLGLAVLALILLLPACDNSTSNTPIGPKYSDRPPTASASLYVFAVHPLHNPAMLYASYQPLIDYLNRNIPNAHFELEASRDYAVYEKKFMHREAEFLLPNPWQTLQAMKVGYSVIAEAGDAKDFRGIFLVRKDSGITRPADLRGKVVSYPAKTALAACIMPQYYLYQAGLDVNRDIVNRYVGSQESSIMNAVMKLSSVGVTWPPPWRAFQQAHPQQAAQLKVIWQTPPLMNNSVMVRDDVPAALAAKVKALLLGLHKDPTGRQILENIQTQRFYPASNGSYDVVRQFIKRFEHKVRRVE